MWCCATWKQGPLAAVSHLTLLPCASLSSSSAVSPAGSLRLQLLSAEGLDKKKELNKVVLRQSVMNRMGAALDDLGEGDEDWPQRAWCICCRQDTHSQDTSVQYSLITSRTAHSMRLAWLNSKTKFDLQASLCPKISLVIWCVTCLIHGCYLTRLPIYVPTTQREHSVHPAHLQAHSVDKLRHQGKPSTTTPRGYEPKELATVSRIEANSGDPYQLYDVQEKLEKKITELLSPKKGRTWRNKDAWCAGF